MFVRLLSTAALAGGFLAAPVQPDHAPAVTTLKYKVGIGSNTVADLSAFGAGDQQTNLGISGYFTMTLRDTTGGQALTILLDSMVIDSATQGLGELRTVADSSKGATWHGVLRKDGKVEDLVFDQGGAGAQQFETVLSVFFPRGGAHTRKTGEVWADTLVYTTTSESGEMNISLITTFTAAGEGTYRGAKALQINTTSTSASAGSQVNQAGEMGIEGSGTGVGQYFVSKDGHYLGGTNTLDSDLAITTSQAPMPIPVKQHTVITITSL